MYKGSGHACASNQARHVQRPCARRSTNGIRKPVAPSGSSELLRNRSRCQVFFETYAMAMRHPKIMLTF